jgi:hypothetical protein
MNRLFPGRPAPLAARINNARADEVLNFCHSSPKPWELIRAVEVDPREAGEDGR